MGSLNPKLLNPELKAILVSFEPSISSRSRLWRPEDIGSVAGLFSRMSMTCGTPSIVGVCSAVLRHLATGAGAYIEDALLAPCLMWIFSTFQKVGRTLA